jgi:sterol desaturase/sphingolipid hydroxylase (fatty acid hydroxylase superfamily)
MDKLHNKEPLRVFKNPFLEALTKTSPMITLLVYIPVILLLLYISFFKSEVTFLKIISFYGAGIFFWTFIEYLLHRFVFHFEGESATTKRIHYVLHGVHHMYPREKEKLFMPPVPGLFLAFVLYLVFQIVFKELVSPFLAGLISGYLIYVFMHYFIHTTRPPKLLEKHWTHHFLHHHRYPEKCFGVSTHFWDKIFGTMPPRKEKKSA